MIKAKMQLVALSVTAALTFFGSDINAFAASNNKVSDVMPQAGFTYALGDNQVSLSSLQQSVEAEKTQTENSSTSSTSSDKVDLSDAVTDITPLASTVRDSVLSDIQNATGAVIKNTKNVAAEATAESSEDSEEELFKSLVIAKVTNYVNVRDIPSEEGEIVGKLYDKSVGTYIEEQDGWYKIQSGSVEGFVKAEFCVTGEDAVELAKEVGTRIATVTTTTLKVRNGAGLDAEVIGLVPIEDELVVEEELDGWVKVSIEEGDGYVSTDYVTLSTEFVKAESKAEEEARLAKEAAARAAANKAAKSSTSKESGSSNYSSASSFTTATSSIGSAVAQFALQFVGNPYVYGGTSLTNGADCSGFVMSVYNNFGVSLPHSSGGDRSVGAAVDGLANAQPGDIVCYSGHVAIYIGNGQIVHASTAKTGIKVSNADYRTVLAVRRIF
ncbi:NLPC/P60 domain-containing protein [Butyrivibrio proteoclasticus B316]|uniref:NLPC/P60 domain-containing protein n=1 Tax=Butyrivibrio proteoclasticus (strain ATCC 51982 / DSM 14932 / B316) TaxID=515622 RepID=E0RVR5_BUTPB|nr:SH3 domain-containing C40 family peptidase [Butyrivibrio proteoclasticus]ADL35223.1 NLPC/P60 domain-containing protein [Butyrivibrio proteoclasticus B316]